MAEYELLRKISKAVEELAQTGADLGFALPIQRKIKPPWETIFQISLHACGGDIDRKFRPFSDFGPTPLTRAFFRRSELGHIGQPRHSETTRYLSEGPSKCRREYMYLVPENPEDGQYACLVDETLKARCVFSDTPDMVWEGQNIIMDPDLRTDQEAEAYLRRMAGRIPMDLFKQQNHQFIRDMIDPWVGTRPRSASVSSGHPPSSQERIGERFTPGNTGVCG